MKHIKISYIVYAVILVVTLGLLVIAAISFHGPSFYDRLTHGCIYLEEGWVLSDGSTASLTHLNENKGAAPYEEYSIFHDIPEKLDSNVSLLLRNKNVFFKVYIDGELRLEPYVGESIVYSKSGGTNWHLIELFPEDAGKTIEIKVKTIYDNERCCIDNIRIDSSASLLLGIIEEHLVAFVTCLLLFFTGVLLIVADFPINRLQEKNHELLFLGTFSLVIALWCLSETNLLQFITGNVQTIQLISYLSLMLIPVPIVFYLNEAFSVHFKFPFYVILAGSFTEFFSCLILHLTKIRDYRETLTFTHIMLGITAVTMLVIIVENLIQLKRAGKQNVYFALRAVGVLAFAVGAILDLIRFYNSVATDAALFTRIAILAFIFCYGFSSLGRTIEAVKMGAQTKFVSQLAYRDGLTGIGNRTAFQEHLTELELKKNSIPAVGIIMFDVNNLKTVNDNMGHHLGDEMLLKSAKIIQTSFENDNSQCFRIGGDEFVVVMDGDNIKTRYENGMNRFDTSIIQYNQQPDIPFKISIANGFAVYNDERRKENENLSLLKVFEEADGLMYENKKRMKGLA